MKKLILLLLTTSALVAQVTTRLSAPRTQALPTNTIFAVTVISDDGSTTNSHIVALMTIMRAGITNTSKFHWLLGADGKMVGWPTNLTAAEITANGVTSAALADDIALATLTVNPLAYNATTWDTSTNVPTRDDIRDIIETVIASVATKQNAFTTGLGITNINNVLSNNIVAGANVTITPGANGQLTIASSGGGSGGVEGTIIHNGSAPVQYALLYHLDTTGTNAAASLITTDATLTNLYVGQVNTSVLVVTNDPAFGGLTLNPLAYDATTWNSSTNVPTRDDIRDEFEKRAPQVKGIVIVDPENQQAISDDFPILAVESSWAPSGITITDIYLKTSASSTYSVTLEEWTTAVGGTVTTIETVATSTSSEAEDDGTLSDASIAAGSIVMVDLPTTAENWISVTIVYRVN